MMTITIPDLWNDISVDVVSPLSILKAQSQYLGKRTKGLVQLDIVVDQKKDSATYSVFLLCPVLNNERYLVDTFHTGPRYYPIFMQDSTAIKDQHEFIDYLQRSFRSDEVRSVLDSFFARINETKPELTKS